MKPVRNYILLVDNYRRPSRQRNTSGRYRVGAKTPDEAVKLLRERIGFGSIQVYYECGEDEKYSVPYKAVVQEKLCNGKIRHIMPHHANAPQKKETEEIL